MTNQNDSEWTDWITHDGKGCPCVGKMVEVVRANGDVSQFIAGVVECQRSNGHRPSVWRLA